MLELSGAGYYAKNQGNLLVGVLPTNILNNPPPGGKLFEPDFGWGFYFSGGYHHRQNALFMDWTHYNVDSFGHDSLAQIFPNAFFRLNSQYDVVDLAYLKEMPASERLLFVLLPGLEWARLQESWHESLVANTPNSLGGEQFADSAEAFGVGPLLKIIIQYSFLKDLYLNLGFSFSIMGFKHTISSSANGRLTGSVSRSFTMRNMVPGMDFKLGGGYRLPTSKEDLVAELLWDKRLFTSGFFAGGNMAWEGLLAGLHWRGEI